MASNIEAIVASGDERRIATALRARSLGAGDIATVDLMKLAWDTPSAPIRNAAAMALLGRHAPGTAELVLKLIARPDTKTTRGSLLHVLNELGVPVPLRTLTSLIAHASIESREEALLSLEHAVFSEEERRRAVKGLQRVMKSADQHKVSIAARAVRLLTEG